MAVPLPDERRGEERRSDARRAYDQQRTYDLGHGTRTGFRAVSLFAVLALVTFLAWFVFGPTGNAPDETPAAGNTQIEQQAAPPTKDEAPTATPAPSPPQPASP
jgi:hypothetical protein